MGAINYDPKTALLLAQVNALTYEQFQKGIQDPKYDGTITPPPGYKQTAVFKAPEIYLEPKNTTGSKSDKFRLSDLNPEKVVLTDIKKLEELVKCLRKVFFGFVLEATDDSGNCIIALRGTQDPYEWLIDAACIQIPIPLVWHEEKKLKLAKAHFGFLFLFAFLKEQINKAAKNFSNPKTCYVTGHSLGAALAVLTALTLGTKVFKNGGRDGLVQMYNYAGPRVGDPTFADAYDYLIPKSYRVVNLADIVPVVPPRSILKYQYQHVGAPDQEWSYCNQTGDIVDNHSLQNNYIPALQHPESINNQGIGGSVLQEIAAVKEK